MVGRGTETRGNWEERQFSLVGSQEVEELRERKRRAAGGPLSRDL